MSGRLTSSTLFSINNTGLLGGSATGSEVVVQDATRGLIYVLGGNGVDALNAATGALAFSIPKSAIQVPGGGAAALLGSGNSVAISGNNLAMSFDGPAGGQNGVVAVFTVSGTPGAYSAAWRATAEVGVIPDMITFTADGTRLLAAIEAEPTAGYATDAPGGLAVIDVASWTSTFYGFGGFDAQVGALRAAGVKIANGFGAGNTALPSTDLEPEYITVVGNTAYVTIQEANAIGVFNLTPGAVGWTAVLPLGLSNHSLAGNGIDTSDRDGGPIIRQVPIFGMYQPDAIASFVQGGATYLVTANEGDAREYGGTNNVFNEAVRISALVPATGSTPPAGMPALDAALLAQIQPRRGDADLGRFEVSRWAGDTDGDGDLDRLQTFGSRSFSIWQVGGTDVAPTITQVWNSGQLLDQIIASQAPSLYDDNRSDNKAAEPEQITLGTVDGQLYAFVGLERANANMAFRINGPTDVQFAGLLNRTGDLAPETSAFIPAAGGNPARLAVANEVSTTTTVFNVTPASTANYTLQILHGSDFEAGLLATQRTDRFAAIVDKLEDALPNSITLSGGDNFIPGPFGAAGTDNSMVPVLRAYWEQALGLSSGSLTSLFGTNLSTATSPFFATDIAILNAIGIQASVLGNHDFDLGTNALAAAIDFTSNTTGTTPAARVTNIGAQFPYLSANLNFAGDAALRALYTATLREASTYATRLSDLADNQSVANEAADVQIAPWTTIVEGGQTIGILGLTTQVLASISTVNGVTVLDPNADGGVDNMAELAAILQPYVDQMTAQGINKIVLMSHLQQFNNELTLAPLLRGVDVIISAGSHAIFADGTDALRAGDTASAGYPVYRTGADGKPVAIVSTSGEYSYVGRLVVTFDSEGVLIADPDGAGALGVGGVDPAISGAYVTTDATVTALWGADNPYADGTRGGEVRQITDQVQTVIAAKDGNVFGRTEVFLEGRRSEVRTEETNLGNLSADANLFVAKQVDSGVSVSLKNGGGIRAEIGAVLGQPVPAELPPLANPSAGKPAGGISQLDIENSLRFNNALSVLTVTAQNLERLFEHAVAATAPGATPGQFAQIGGVSFSYDLSRTAQVVNATSGVVGTVGERVRNLVILNEDGSIADTIVTNGALQGDPNRLIKVVTLSFLADGGDAYPFLPYTVAGSRTDLLNNAALGNGVATFATKGSEQDAFAEYVAARHGTEAKAFDNLDVSKAQDLRIQDVAARADTVLTPYAQVTVGERVDLVQMTTGTAPFAFSFTGTSASETILAHNAAELIDGGAGNDSITARGGNDSLIGGTGNDTLDGGMGNDSLDGGAGNDSLIGGAGDDTYTVTSGTDIIVELAGEGTDTVNTSLNSFTLAANVENLTFTGGGNFTGTGNNGNNLIAGRVGNDTLTGGVGNDTLDGGRGNDSMVGGTGNDSYTVDSLTDMVVEAAGEGTDTVMTTVGTYTLGANVENVTYTGPGRFTGNGNTLANAISGNVNHDTLLGGAGNDTLTGGGGNDRLDGGAGNDVAIFEGTREAATITRTGVGNWTITTLAGGTDRLIGVEEVRFGNGSLYTSSESAYMVPTQPNVSVQAILSAGDVAGVKADGTPWRMVGIPDGLGAFDNGNGTITILMNHEIGATNGVVREHGAIGAFVSEIILDKATLAVISAGDLADETYIWNGTSYTLSPTAMGRLCSADLPPISAFYDAASGLGTQDRIFMNGEEIGAEGRAFAWVATGAEAGTAWELPELGRFSWENSLANPYSGAKTVVIGTDDSTPGQVYLYVGDKQATGTAIEKAGLTNGQLYGIVAQGIGNGANSENLLTTVPLSGNFTLAALANSGNGAALQTESNTAGVTEWWRPEDGAWDTVNENRFYFVTTANVTSPSRLWALDFVDSANPTLGGTFTALLDGTEGHRMLDNMTVGKDGTIILQEDVGGNDRLGKQWHYDPSTDALTEISQHDPARFTPGAPGFLTRDEEGSGIIEVTDMLGDADTRAFLFDTQAHYDFGAAGSADRIEIVRGGQLQVMYIETRQTGTAGNNTLTGTFIGETLLGLAGNDSLLGAGGSDSLDGGHGNDTLVGGIGNDTLNGGFGNDSMVGGAGNDSYMVNSFTDVVVEAAGEGTDTVLASLGNHTLGANVENLTYTGIGRFTGNGNDLANAITGNVNNDTLNGGNGADSLMGMGGSDRLNGGAGADMLDGGAAVDVLDGGLGADMLTGGLENDVFRFVRGEAEGDAITDFAGNGNDAGDRLVFVGYGSKAAGATFTSMGGNDWQIRSADGLTTEIINITGAVVAQDWIFS